MSTKVAARGRKLVDMGGKASAMIIGAAGSDGSFTSISDLRNAGMDIVRENGKGELEIVARSLDSLTSRDTVERALQEILEDANPFSSFDGIVEIPWAFDTLSTLLTSNVTHASAIETKAADYAFGNLILTPTSWSVKNVDEKVLEDAKQQVIAFFSHAARTSTGIRPISDLLRDVAIDYEALGTAGFEVRRNTRGIVTALNHIPFSSMRVLKDAVYQSNKVRYVQRRFQRTAFFTPLNELTEYIGKDGRTFNPDIAPESDFPSYEGRLNAVRYRRGPYPNVRTGQLDAKLPEAANEFIMISRPPFTKSSIYVTPAGISAYGNMLAQLAIDKFNLAFFNSKGVPQYAIIFKKFARPSGDEGVNRTGDPAMYDGDVPTMSSSEVTALEETLRMYFQTQLMQSDRGVLVLTMFGDAEVSFERLSTEKLEASFGDYEKRNQEAIRIAHHVPGAAIGIYDAANLGSGRDTTAMKRYRDHIVIPGQRMLASVVTRILRCGLLIPYFDVSFQPVDLEEEEIGKKFALDAFRYGGYNLNDFLVAVGKLPLPYDAGKFRLASTLTTRIPDGQMAAEGVTPPTDEQIKMVLKAVAEAFPESQEFLALP